MARKLAEIKAVAREIFLLETFDNYEQHELIEILQFADNLYHNDQESFLSDAEYDTLRRYTEHLGPNHTYFLGVGSEIRGGKVKLPFKMGSLTQAYEGDTVNWISKYRLNNELIIATDKLDGVSALVIYDNNGELQVAYSRGDGVEGADITRHIRKIPSVPSKVDEALVVRGELIIAKDNFSKAQATAKSRSGKSYKNPRNMMAGLMNARQNTDDVYQYIDFVAYEIVKSADHKGHMLAELSIKHDFKVPGWTNFKGQELSDVVLTTHLNARREKSKYEIDGIVLDVNDGALRSKINPTKETLNPEYARKFKVADTTNNAQTTVIRVEWNTSKHGYLKPTVHIKPVELVGVTVSKCTGFNAKFINENGIGSGAIVQISRAGDVIPFLHTVVKSVQPQMPTEDWVWNQTKVDAVLKNMNNDTVRFEQMNDFFATIDAPHLGDGNLQTMFDNGFNTIEKILQMSERQMGGLIGANGSKIYKGLRIKLTNIPMYVLMGAHPAFGRGIGVRRIKALWIAFEGNMSKCTSAENILAVDGFKDKTADKIVQGYPEFISFFENIKHLVTIAQFEKKNTGGLSGSSYVMTGFRDKALEKQVEGLGGTFASSVSKKTTAVIAANPVESSTKIRKAKELGIPVLSLEDFQNMLANHT